MAKYLPTTEVSKMLRKKLKTEFPGIKFSVRSDKSAINISWTDGPTAKMVEKVTSPYAGGGFDGMIDMAYNVRAYMLADGFTLVYGESSGTTDSAGVISGYKNELPEGAEIVSPMNNFVFVNREYSAEFLRRGAEKAANYWGYEGKIEIDGPTEFRGAWVKTNDFVKNADEWFATLVHREMVKRVPASFLATLGNVVAKEYVNRYGGK